ncbi:MAG TPA: peptidylprolyl isomerase [Bacteroidia bacterium]|nr:peptidylprolyl isomerase [Bacteroidia bacterium]HRS59494.1 peptidylprolyl isomerase [Bacteroidia bacterium]HRU67614.1 peptidylprolyl isomerase [Bacteroidia bacterium]
MNKITVLAVILFLFLNTYAQEDKTLDKIIAVVGNQIVTQSDIDIQLKEYNFPDEQSLFEGTCELIQASVFQRLLLNQAYIDSLKVSDAEISGEIDKRLQYFINQLGSKEALEKFYEKTIPEIKDEMREPIKEMKLVQMMRQKIVGDVFVSPAEVKKFFNQIPEDSLPYYNTQYEIAQIVFFAKPTEEEHQKARAKLEEIRQRILKGDKFSTLAILYSEDPGTAIKGGDLGMRSRFDYVPEFASAAMKLKKDSISDIIKTQYGYHLIKMIDRKGEMIHVAHILIIPKVTPEAKLQAQSKAREVLSLIKKDSVGFEAAAFKYSEDETTKNNGGRLVDINTGSTRLSSDQMEASLFFVIDTMQTGSVAGPVYYVYPDGRQAYRLIWLKSKIPPHKANLNDDYPIISDMAKSRKEQELLLKWINNKMKETYFKVNPPYDQCEDLKKYMIKD